LLRQRHFVAFLACACTFIAGHSSYDLCGSLFFRDLGASGDAIGLLWVTGVSGEIALFFLAAPLARRVRPERLLVLAYACGALRWLLTSLLPGFEHAFWVQPLHGVSFGVTWLASLAYVRRVAGPRLAGGAQGLFMAAQAAGGALGMLGWGPLYERSGGRTVFALAAGLSLLAALLALAALRGAPSERRADGRV
jgi:PPP family 3-phenylpropionic acid transporter